MTIPKLITFSILFFLLFDSEVSAQVRLESDVAEKLLIDAPLAAYPPIAAAAGAKGIVKVEIIVSEQGAVNSAKAISGHPLLQRTAVNAVKQYRYRGHEVEGKPVTFTAVVEVVFPPGKFTKEEKLEIERQDLLAKQFFKEDKECRDLGRMEDWKAAEIACSKVMNLADQLEADRYMEKMRANEFFGHILMHQKRYLEAIKFYNRAMTIVGTNLTEQDAELGRLWADLAMANHLMRDLAKAREFYRKAVQIYQNAYASLGDDSDEWVQSTKKGYLKSMKILLQSH